MLTIVTVLLLSGTLATDVWKTKKDTVSVKTDNVDDIFNGIIPKGHENPEVHFPNAAPLPGFFNVLKMSDQLIGKVNKPGFNPLTYAPAVVKRHHNSMLTNAAKSQKEMMDAMSGNMDLKPPMDDDDLKKDTIPTGECKILASRKSTTDSATESDYTLSKPEVADAERESTKAIDDEFKKFDENSFDTAEKSKEPEKNVAEATGRSLRKDLTIYAPLRYPVNFRLTQPSRVHIPLPSKANIVLGQPSSNSAAKPIFLKPISLRIKQHITGKAKVSVAKTTKDIAPKIGIAQAITYKTPIGKTIQRKISLAKKSSKTVAPAEKIKDKLTSAQKVSSVKSKQTRLSNISIPRTSKGGRVYAGAKLTPTLIKQKLAEGSLVKTLSPARLSGNLAKSVPKVTKKSVISNKVPSKNTH